MNRLHPQQVHHHPGHGGHHHPAAGHPGHPIGYNKDDIYNWFRTLNNWNRIDLMCGLLDLCHPFEVKNTDRSRFSNERVLFEVQPESFFCIASFDWFSNRIPIHPILQMYQIKLAFVLYWCWGSIIAR